MEYTLTLFASWQVLHLKDSIVEKVCFFSRQLLANDLRFVIPRGLLVSHVRGLMIY